MANLMIAFITGLTTGGLSCLAVQGGLLASSLAGQIEKEFQAASLHKGRTRRPASKKAAKKPNLAPPIAIFLAAKLAAYTSLGFLLGLVGQAFQLSALSRAILQIGIGIFMLGTALRMLNVHPIFRIFAIEPPAFLRRKLRRAAAAANEEEKPSLLTPAFLGLMTVLIPCGVTQAMMAAAIATANPLQAAALMFAFTLGTSPVFFAVSYFATRLGARLEKYFLRFTAVVVLVLALITIDTGAALAGSPFSLVRWVNSVFAPAAQPAQTAGENTAPGSDVITIQVQNRGYSPEVLHAPAEVPLRLRLVSENVRSCSLAIVIPALKFEKLLQPTGETLVNIPAQPRGTTIPYTCSMGMYGGTIIFDL